MKKNLLILTLMISTAFAGISQKKNVTSAIMASKPNKKQYVKAKMYIDKASKHPDTKGQAKTWYYKAFIYAQLANSKKPSIFWVVSSPFSFLVVKEKGPAI